MIQELFSKTTKLASEAGMASAHHLRTCECFRELYTAGEGAGYAGGILSAGVDGIKVAEALAKAVLA